MKKRLSLKTVSHPLISLHRYSAFIASVKPSRYLFKRKKCHVPKHETGLLSTQNYGGRENVRIEHETVKQRLTKTQRNDPRNWNQQ